MPVEGSEGETPSGPQAGCRRYFHYLMLIVSIWAPETT